MSLGAVAFTHIVKAAEPVFSTVLTGLILKKWAAWQVRSVDSMSTASVLKGFARLFTYSQVNLSLLPVILGVVIASVTIVWPVGAGVPKLELGDFNLLAFGGAMLSNLAFALRSIYMKAIDDTEEKKKSCKTKNLSPDNIFALYTIFAFVMAIPLALCTEGREVSQDLEKIAGVQNFKLPHFSNVPLNHLIEMHLITGLFFYLYNEASSLALGSLDGVAHVSHRTLPHLM